MQSTELKLGRTFAVNFEHGKDFFEELREFCAKNEVKQGYIPMFIAGLSEVELVGACEKLEDENAPVWSKVYLRHVEAVGGGTLAFDTEHNQIYPHIHISVGLKGQSANGYTSHLLSGKVEFLVEMIVVEVLSPDFRRIKNESLYDIPLLTFIK
ncbi:MAG TPA: PPC domain-containing DNA-binding protein [Blastocatellia bacterium]|nr:PPC domain-containing DNA-binding protein [Blastocatellia bacterium]